MAALKNGSVVIADPDRALVWLVSANLTSVRQISLLPGDEPGRVVESADGHVYVVLRRADQLAELDLAAGTVRRLESCHLPRGLAVRAGKLVVACLSGELETLDPTTGARTPVVTDTGLSDLRDVVVDGDALLVTELRSGAIRSIAADGVVTTLGATPLTGFTPHVAWRAVPMPQPWGGALVVRQEHRSLQIPASSACSAYYGPAQNVASGGGSGASGGVVLSEALIISGTTARATSLAEGRPVVLPVDAAVSPSGRVAVLSAGTGELVLLQLGGRLDLPLVVHGVDRQLTSVVFVGEKAFVFAREPAQLLVVSDDGSTFRTVNLGGASVASTGHELFHRGTSAGLACASCHPEAGEDGHVWPFVEGLRRTPTLRGGLGGTQPYHWSGDMPRMNELLQSVMTTRMKGPSLSDANIASVERWLTAQPALSRPKVDAAAAARGRVLFESQAAACSSCHSGPQGTNNATVAVGTGARFQVPRLAELAWRGPWLHDGRMRSFEARFEPSSGGESHGHVAQLTAAERTDMIEYLKTR